MDKSKELPVLYNLMFGEVSEQDRKLAEHRAWLNSRCPERPSKMTTYRVGIYIRYFNQTKYENYLENHKKQFLDMLQLCPKWTLVDFYIDEGSVAPNMESAPEWCRLLEDCTNGQVDLIITQKASNVSRKPHELTIASKILAAQVPPVGIYFISEDIFTMASYYQEDMRDDYFLQRDSIFEIADDVERGMLNDS